MNFLRAFLSQYDPKNLTTEQAKSIFQAFKDAGIKPGKGLKEALTSAGFDANQLLALARPADSQAATGTTPATVAQGHHHRHHKAAAADRTTTGSSDTTVNTTALKTLQDILDKYDLSNLSSTDETSLLSDLTGSGLMKTGGIIDLKS